MGLMVAASASSLSAGSAPPPRPSPIDRGRVWEGGIKAMLNTAWAVIRNGKIELLQPLELLEGAKVLITTLFASDESHFWLAASHSALAEVWDNPFDILRSCVILRVLAGRRMRRRIRASSDDDV